MKSECVVLFSGSTDSLCTAALSCEKFAKVHLLTFFEKATANSPVPVDNINRLKAHYPSVEILHSTIQIDLDLKRLCYQNYFSNLIRFKFLNLATPGLSSLSWHISAIRYCRKNSIHLVFDGMTRELLHLPGHMPEVRDVFSELYEKFEIQFSSPVIDWEVPIDQRFVDKLIVDRHGFELNPVKNIRSTGQWLFEKKILPHSNIKGSAFDRLMQHDCYPFVVYNMMVFWIYQPLFGYEKYKIKLVDFFRNKMELATRLSNEPLS